MSGPGFGFGQGPGSARRHRPRTAGDPTYTAAFTLTQFAAQDAKRIYQRMTTSGGGQGKGQGTIRMTISGATAGTVGARIRSDDGVTILQSEWTAGAIANGATFIDVTGVDARLGWFYVDLKGADGSWQLGTVKVGMGALFGFAGQSLMARIFARVSDSGTYASNGLTANDNSATLAWSGDGTAYTPAVATMPWLTPGDRTDGTGPNSTGIGELLNRMIALLGVNCGGIGSATGGADIGSFITGGVEWTKLSAILARAGNAFEGFFWGQGHSNAAGNLPAKAYANALSKVFAQLTALNGFAGYGKYVWTIPALRNISWGSPYGANNIRRGADLWCAANGGVHVHAADTDLTDNVHEGQTGAITLARHMYRATRAYYGASSGLGPAPLSATRSGTTITLTLSDVGQTTLSLLGTAGSRVFVFPTGRLDQINGNQANRFPVSSVSVASKTTLSIVLANDPGDGHALDLYMFWPNGPDAESADAIYDDRLDGDGLTRGRIVQANFVPIAIAAPAPGGTVNAPPGGFIAAASRMTLTETSVTYGASDGGGSFGQQMTGGRAQATNNSCPLFSPVTAELFFTCPTLSAGTQVLLGGIGTLSGYFGINSAGKLVADGVGGLIGATTLVAGRRYHAAYQGGPNGRAIYLTDITSGTPGVRDAFSATAAPDVREGSWQFAVRSSGGSANAVTGGGAVDEVAVFYGERYSGSSYTCPSGPFSGAETDIVALYHCNGNGIEAVAT